MNRMLKAITVAAMVTLAAGQAHAATVEIQFFGASAQYNFWKTLSGTFFKDTLGCAASDYTSYTPASTNEGNVGGHSHFVAVCRGSDAYQGLSAGTGPTKSYTYTDENGASHTLNVNGKTVVFKYTSSSSYEGPLSVSGTKYYDDAGLCATAGQRKVVTGLTVSGGTTITGATISCGPVNFGTADVAASSFSQTSNGNTLGPCNTTYVSRDVSGVAAEVDPNLAVKNPLAVPFAFFASDNVPFNNLSRVMAVNLFAGNVNDWNQFTGGASLPVALCLRHAGSGTHGTLDTCVMRSDASLVTDQVDYDGDTSHKVVYFNNGTGDLMKCIGGGCSGGNFWTGKAAYGRIGYADADAVAGIAPGTEGTAVSSNGGMIKRLTLDGVGASRANIQNGMYAFWSAQNVYYQPTLDSNKKALGEAMVGFCNLDSNIDMLSDNYTELFWSSISGLKVNKGADTALPLFF